MESQKFISASGEWVVTRKENDSIIVTKDGATCPNAIAALRDIAAECKFKYDDEWNTRQFGANLIKFLSENPQIPPVSGPRVRVYAKAQNRTALGIMHAYMVMYPQAKLEDIEKAFPNSLNPDSGVKKNFVYAEDKGTTADWNGFFKKEEELLTMGDGREVSVVSMWTKPSLERLVAWAKQYGIVVADFEASKGGSEKGGYRLEYLNGYVPPKKGVSSEPKKVAGKEQVPSKEEKPRESNKLVVDVPNPQAIVYGKLEPRLVLGIVRAFVAIFPEANGNMLRTAFDKSLNNMCNLDNIRDYSKNPLGTDDAYFTDLKDVVQADTRFYQVCSKWNQDSIQKLISHVSQFGIGVVLSKSEVKSELGEGYRIEYQNGYVPPKPKPEILKYCWAPAAIHLILLSDLTALLIGDRSDESNVCENAISSCEYVSDDLKTYRCNDTRYRCCPSSDPSFKSKVLGKAMAQGLLTDPSWTVLELVNNLIEYAKKNEGK